MPNKCCVPLCKGNYEKIVDNKNTKDHRIAVYAFPSNEEDKISWIKSIPRSNLTVTKYSVVCGAHWPTDTEFITVPGGKKRPKFAPSVFPNIPKSILPTEKPKERSTKRSLSSQRSILKDEFEEFLANDLIDYASLVKEAQNKYEYLQC